MTAKRRRPAAAVLLFAGAILGACRGDAATPPVDAHPGSDSGTVRLADTAVASVEITGSLSPLPGDTGTLRVVARNRAGEDVGQRPARWLSSDTAVLVVNQRGHFRTIGVPSDFREVEVTATVGALTGVRWAYVRAIDYIAIPDTSLLLARQTRRLAVVVPRDASPAHPTQVIAWASSNPRVATVDASGTVTAVGDGMATVTATLGVTTARAVVAVTHYPKPLRFAQVSVGGSHACALTIDGEAYCWGSNYVGQLGTSRVMDVCQSLGYSRGNVTDRSTLRCSALPVPVETALRFASLASNAVESCGVTADGAAWCWGAAPPGRVAPPHQVGVGLRFRSLSPPCGVTVDDATYCWGPNPWLLGVESTATRVVGDTANPIRVARGISVAAAGAFESIPQGTACALGRDGAIYCWGSDSWGQLGLDASVAGDSLCAFGCTFAAHSVAPVRVRASASFSGVSVGGDGVCGTDTSSRVWCWGHWMDWVPSFKVYGVRVPRRMGDQPLQSLSAAENHFCAIGTAGRLYCWGAGLELGPFESTYPVEIPLGGLALRSVATYSITACGIATDDRVYCWGSSFWGRLGDGNLPGNGDMGAGGPPGPVRVAGQGD